MVERVNLTDRKLKALKPADAGKRYDVMDTDVRNLGVRVTDKGLRTFILVARFPGSSNPTRRAIGEYPTVMLEKARKTARMWLDLISAGIDPKEELERKKRAELRKRADTFESAVDEYAKRVLPKQRRGKIVEHELRQEFCERWGGRAITSIERRDVTDAIKDVVDRGAMYQAHNLLGHLRAFFNWAISTEDYGLEYSPCDRIRPKLLIGERKPRQRVLTDVELKAFWLATGKMAYPFGPLFRLLLLTGCRKSEMGEARWREIEQDKRLLTIPPERFKSDAPHLVPLTREVETILASLPRFTTGDYLFSTTYGAKPVHGPARAKDRLDRLMAEELEEFTAFRLHDLRRTMRTRLASLKVPDTVAEMVIGHGKRGLGRVYDQHRYLDEIREALELWARLLRDIVTPPPANLVRLKKETA